MAQRRGCSRSLPVLRLAASLWLAAVWLPLSARAWTFTLDRSECFYQHVPKHQSTMVGFVVTRYENYWPKDEAEHLIDVKIFDPTGREMVSSLAKSKDELYFWSQDEGDYKVCAYNKAGNYAQVNMDFLEYYQFVNRKGGSEVATDEHADPVHQELARLAGDLASTHHDLWFAFYLAQQHIEIDKTLNRRLLWKTALQGLLLVACGVAQVWLLQRLFEKRMRTSRV